MSVRPKAGRIYHNWQADGVTHSWEVHLANLLRAGIVLHGCVLYQVQWWAAELQLLQGADQADALGEGG